MKTISAKRLEKAGACPDQVKLFRDTFGEKPVRLTQENWDKAGEAGLYRIWLERFLEGPARDEHLRMCRPAWAEYERVRGPTWGEHVHMCEAAWAEYARVRDAALFAALTGDF